MNSIQDIPISRAEGYYPERRRMITPEALEARAQALENMQPGDFEVNPVLVADVLDGKLKKTKTGRAVINALVSGISFAAATVSFRRVAPKLRKGISGATGKIAANFRNIGSRLKITNMSDVADEMSKDASKLAQKGDGKLLKAGITKVFGEQKAQGVLDALKKVGIETGGDVADTTIAVGAALLAGREAGDIADDTQKELSLKDAVRDITKVMNALPGAEIVTEL